MTAVVTTTLFVLLLFGYAQGGMCPKWHRSCDGTRCIRNWRQCDGVPDCEDGTDEAADFCRGFKCTGDKKKCADGLQCVKQNLLCNDKINCLDASDESAAQCGARDCEAAQFLDQTNFCQKCPKDTWSSPLNKASTCTPCPSGKGVIAGQGKQESDCEWKPCKAGKYLDQIAGCQKCPVDTYARYGNTEPTCTPCPAGLMVGVGQGKKESDCTDSYTCPGAQFLCDRSKCVTKWKLCNGKLDCDDGADEAPDFCRDYTCIEGGLKCADGLQCIRERNICNKNGVVHCKDGSDESVAQCGGSCPGNQQLCDGSKCIKQWRLCDGKPDCEDGTDEAADFCRAYSCPPDKQKCADGLQCFTRTLLCNEKLNCNDASDESAEQCGVRTCAADLYLNKYNLCKDKPEYDVDDPCVNDLPPWRLCNGEVDCESGSDESVEFCQEFICYSDKQKCADGLQCVKTSLQCNGVINCNDGSDEAVDKCGVLCDAGKFLDGSNSCKQCPKNTWSGPANSASSCTPCPSGLSVDAGKGRKESDCEWRDECLSDLPTWKLCNGQVDCDNGFDESAAFCLGYTCEPGKEKCDDGLQCIKTTLKCDGVTNCNDGSDESTLVCEGSCPKFQTQCDDGSKCFKNWRLCDGKQDCGDASDEKPGFCRDFICPAGRQKCRDGLQCIKTTLLCDGVVQCNDGSDESNILCGDGSGGDGSGGDGSGGDGSGTGGDGTGGDTGGEIIGVWGEFGDWSACSTVCGDGIQTRSRSCEGGTVCEGSSSETRPCSNRPCPIHGGWGVYTGWSACSARCGGGTQTQTRACNNPAPAYGGVSCVGSRTETRQCNVRSCRGTLILAKHDFLYGVGINSVLTIIVYGRPNSWNGDISFLAGSQELFLIGLHPESQTLAVRNNVFGRGSSQWGYQWVVSPYPEADEEGKRVYHLQFTSTGFVLKCFDVVLISIPFDELSANTAQFLYSLNFIKFNLFSDTGTILVKFARVWKLDTSGLVASQSSDWAGGEAGLAIDGNTDGFFDKGSCSHTATDQGNWWSIDLGENYEIHKIVIYSRQDSCCAERINGATVTALEGDTEVQSCGKVHYKDGEEKYEILCYGLVVANQIRIDQPNNNLSLCEIEIYAEPERLCPTGQVQCSDGVTCIGENSVCNGVGDCPGDTDEANCEEHLCLGGYRKCSDGRTCIENTSVCDGDTDCPDGVDELHCEDRTDGGWSGYGDWTECSVACGGGFQTRARTCTNPTPSNGGADCQGQNRKSQTCNAQDCPGILVSQAIYRIRD